MTPSEDRAGGAAGRGARDASVFPPRFDPEEWEFLHSGREAARTFALRRGLELARDACLAHGRPGDLWLDAGCGRGQLARALTAGGRRVVRLDVDRAMLVPLEPPDANGAHMQPDAGARDAHTSTPAPGATNPHAHAATTPTPGVTTPHAHAATTPTPGATGGDGGVSGVNAHLPGVCAATQSMPLRAGSFDGVAAVSLLGCLVDPRPFFEEAARVLGPGGVLTFTHTKRESVLLRLSRFFARGPRPGDPISGRIRLHSTRSIMSALDTAGFEIVERRPYHFCCDFGRWSFPSPAQSRRWERSQAWRWLGRNQLVVARRRSTRTASP